MSKSITLIELSAHSSDATSHVKLAKYTPVVLVVRGKSTNDGWEYAKWYHHVTPSSMVRAFLAAMTMVKRANS